MGIVSKTVGVYKRYGLKGFCTKLNEKISSPMRTYGKRVAEFLPTEEELGAQREHRFLVEPCISIVVPAYETNEQFLKELSWDIDKSRLDIREERVYYMPENLPMLKGVRFLRSGLLLGEVKKNRFEPSQALAMCLKKEEYPRILDLPVSDDRVIKYLKGETLDVEDITSRKEKGWYLVCVDGYPLGFGKLANQTLKNKYLPGWRWMS